MKFGVKFVAKFAIFTIFFDTILKNLQEGER